MTFWQTATLEAKLEQLIAGRELGMTWDQIAICVRAPSGQAVMNWVRDRNLTSHFEHKKQGYFAKQSGKNKSRDCSLDNRNDHTVIPLDRLLV